MKRTQEQLNSENKFGMFAILCIIVGVLGFIIYHQMLRKPIFYDHAELGIMILAGLFGVKILTGANLLKGIQPPTPPSSISPDLKSTRKFKLVFLFLQIICIPAFGCDSYRAWVNSDNYALICDIIIIASLVFLCLQAARGKKKIGLDVSIGLSLVMFLGCLFGVFANLHPNGPFIANSKSVPVLICLEAAVFLCGFISLILRYKEIGLSQQPPSNPVQP
ncbi:MAG TPA: hypothetical protein VMG59_03710 [Phycisphaerae bacterium]|nr:hypothetical protein [Phycisphaerae bacterium]